jgi:hypothetical protein
MTLDSTAKQQEFTDYIRDPLNNPSPPDVKVERIAMYRELIFTNIDNFLSSNFPVIRTLYDDPQWADLVQDFFAKHTSKTPYFSEIPEEFLAYLQTERDNANDYPFLLELAHYEWAEMAVAIAKHDSVVNEGNSENLLTQRIQVSPLAWPLAYQYPVHKIAPNFLPLEAPAEPTCLIVYRDPNDDVQFLEITPITYCLLEIIQQNDGILVQDCLQQVAASLPNPEVVIAAGLEIMQSLYAKTIVRLAV